MLWLVESHIFEVYLWFSLVARTRGALLQTERECIMSNQRNVYIVPVNYDLTHRAQIEEAKFNWITDCDNNLILQNPTEHLYPLPTGEMTQRIMLVHLNHVAKREEIIAEMDKLNVRRPVLSPEFLAFTRAYPDLQRQFPLVGLGSVWVDSHVHRHVLCAYKDSDKRNLDLYWDDFEWFGHCRFPAVCKEVAL